MGGGEPPTLSAPPPPSQCGKPQRGGRPKGALCCTHVSSAGQQCANHAWGTRGYSTVAPGSTQVIAGLESGWFEASCMVGRLQPVSRDPSASIPNDEPETKVQVMPHLHLINGQNCKPLPPKKEKKTHVFLWCPSPHHLLLLHC